MKTYRILGIMSGTSVDGVDYALCTISEKNFHLEKFWSVDYPPKLRARIHAVASGSVSSYELAQLHHDLGRFYAEQARKGLKGATLDAVGLHGQTVFHNPNKRAPATLQIGEPSYLAEVLKTSVIANFRAADMAAGGEAAPLATLFHKAVFGQRGMHVCVNNLGGISNVTSIDWSEGAAKPHILAFDTGPANVLVDMAMRHFSAGRLSHDADGSWGERGIASERLLKEWLKHPYFLKKPPKSTGRELFGEKFFKRVVKDFKKVKTPNGKPLGKNDLVATLTEFTARSIAMSYAEYLKTAPEVVILAGGGSYNPGLVRRIRKNMHLFNPDIQITTSEAYGWSSQSIEAAAFALLAYYRLEKKPGNIPETTGARHPAILGQIAEA